ncbi:hypothetical protein CDL12_20445 [Handroanthus impetiginosus]|uniref:TF-B3 domain-containing protein n=1 Tax=Handroanthus impetiginosus TaxID=429701 RepID=A0A2G9GP56_9LAMI|nr:hypothetical protein CDL12_20445 [Handroanthus impetiginosus]
MGKNPAFFKILLMDSYTSRLSLPGAFVKKHGEVVPENAKLRNSSGETWEVKVAEENVDDEKAYFFTEGWNRFASDMELKTGELLVFFFDIGTSTFDVSVYGISGCEKKLSAENVQQSEDSDSDLSFASKLSAKNVTAAEDSDSDLSFASN